MKEIKINYELNLKDIEILKRYKKEYKKEILEGVSDEFKRYIKKYIKIDLNSKDKILREAGTKVVLKIGELLFKNNKNKKNNTLDLYYGIYLPYQSYIASYMIGKIKIYIRTLITTNSKNILYGDHKEKWGSIVGHITTNRKDLALKIINYVKRQREKYPDISSSYTISLIGSELLEKDLKGLNDYKSIYKYKWNNKKRNKYFKKRKIIKHNGIISKYNNKNRKKTINRKIRLLYNSNLL